MKRIAWLIAGLMVLALPLVAAAQGQAGSVAGVVTDSSGGVLPGATVTVKSASGAVKTTVTDGAGHYTIADLAAGAYELSIEMPGFTKQVSKVAVAAGQPFNQDVKLTIAAQAESVQVTGTLIPRPTLEAMTPVTTMNVEELSYQGRTRLEDLLTTLPQVFTAQNSTVANGASGTATVNLRNLGPQRTLVLVDGRRLPTGDTVSIEPDINFVPAALVKRVDVLTGGASSVYGADAVAGVVNFVLDRDFNGVRAGYSPGGFQHTNNDAVAASINQARGFTYPTGSAWDGGQYDAYVAFGGAFGERKGHAVGYLDYRKTNALLKNSRDYTNCSVSSLGANGPVCGGSGTSATGRFLTNDGGDYTVNPATGNTFTDFGPQYLFNYAVYNYMQRPDQRWAAGGFLNYDWNARVQGYAETMLMNDNTDAQIAPSGDFGNTLEINCNNPMLSPDQYQKICTNAGYGPTDTALLQIYRRNVEGGPRIDKLGHLSFRLVGGVRGELSKGWNYDAYTLDAETRRAQSYLNDTNVPRLQDALTVDGDPNDPATWHCRSGNAGCAPWDVFKAGGVTQAALNYVMLPLVSNASLRTQLVSGKVTADLKRYGVVVPSAAEGVSIAGGAEYRKESLDLNTDLAFQMGWGAGQGGPVLPVSGSYNVKDLFTEVSIPLVQEARGAREFTVGLGYRYSDYNITGSHPSWKVEGVWAPTADLKVRAGFNRAVRSPNVIELYGPRTLGLLGSTDPCAGETPSLTAEQCARQGVTAAQYGSILESPAAQYNTISSGDSALVPETADARTLGVVISPKRMPGFSTALDYYDIKLSNTIGAYGADDILKTCGATGELCNFIHRDQFGSLWRTTDGYTESVSGNIGKKRTRGLDANINYMVPALHGTFSFNFIGSYLMKAEINTGLYEYDCVGLTGPICNDAASDHPAMQPKWRHLFRASWDRNKLTLSAGWRMIGPVTAEQLSDQSALADPSMAEQLRLNLADKYPAYHYIDLAGAYKLSRNMAVTVGMNNVFDKVPPLGSGSSANDYGAGFYGTYDSYGRYVHLGLQFTF